MEKHRMEKFHRVDSRLAPLRRKSDRCTACRALSPEGMIIRPGRSRTVPRHVLPSQRGGLDPCPPATIVPDLKLQDAGLKYTNMHLGICQWWVQNISTTVTKKWGSVQLAIRGPIQHPPIA